ncbi:hypothetical protein [Clostridium magnum]|uniref:Uncharacterized protein n=1 Tax=Clostridium magnum DSM 2767 TaxID=1121326 RepID=A0A161YLT2_9CLOT|nr:hypothetical protein [Clostridium magnum]KZL91572.1 hypothetical protein CLMAG_33310 [Clostridium magnum DSM 2767]SHH48052.1 hypothetical protein SAMN02745944_00768 [Clostridium magnum DSM 2767]
MVKKFFVILSSILVLLFIIAGVHMLEFHNKFKNYLKTTYPNEKFSVGMVKYDLIINNIYYSSVYCLEDGTKFYIRSTKSGEISEEYLQTLNMSRLNKLLEECLKKEKIKDSINNIRAGVDKTSESNTDKNIDYKNIDKTVFVVFNENRFENNQKFAEAIYELIKVLKNNEIKINSIVFWYNDEEKAYEVRLENEDINRDVNKIYEKIEVIKQINN